ncbi:MAG: hypothetical protein WBP55_03025, partial [Solirubrobacterales bacterium]
RAELIRRRMVIRDVRGITLRNICGRMVASMIAAGAMLLAAGQVANAATGVPDREADPVVLTGDQVPGLLGVEPGRIVAFSWDGSWKQVPVQVDERKVVELQVVRQRTPSNRRFMAEVYADAGTWAGADGEAQVYSAGTDAGQVVPGSTGDSRFDENDEIAMMSRDAGDSAADETDPSGVVGSSRTPVRINDPLNPDTNRFLYLFQQSSGLDPSAGQDLVSYNWIFSPALAGGYFGGYNFDSIGDNVDGPPVNPEASVVTTGVYEQAFPGRWMIDGLKIKVDGSTGVDILDGDKSTVGVGSCGRNELTFSRGGGGAIANIDGPVRAIRSYVGANSGTFTQRDQIYYEGRADTITYLRVHEGITDFIMAMDYSEAAYGMTYRSSTNPAGVTIDGQGGGTAGSPDEGTDGLTLTGRMDWDQATGAQGSLTNVTRIDSDIPDLTFGSYYQDNLEPPSNNDAIICSGDSHAIGASGPRVTMQGRGSNTDPTLDPTPPSTVVNNFTGHRTTFYSGPGATAETGALRSRQVDSPLTVSVGANVDPALPVGQPGKPGRQNWVGLKVSAGPANVKARIGKRMKIRVKVRNIGDKTARKIKICPRAKNRLVKTSRCKTIGKLKPSRRSGRTFAVRLRGTAAGKKAVKVKFRAKASKSHARSDVVNLRPRGRR